MDKNQFKTVLGKLAVDYQLGAGALTRMCLQYAADSALHAPAKDVAVLRALLEDRANQLVATRPGTAPLVNLLSRWKETLDPLKLMDLENARWTAAQSAMDLLQTSRNALLDVAAKAQEFVADGSIIISHGAGSTVTEVFRQCREKGVQAIITETRPFDLGYQLAHKLSQWNVATTLILEAQMGTFVKQADLAIVGADSLLPDGSVINTPGTYLLALAAHDQGIPFYVCCESFKRLPAGAGHPVLEEFSERTSDAPPLENVSVASLRLEVTPAWLVTAWVTEQSNETGAVPESG